MIDFNGSKTIDEIDVFTLQDNYASPSEPTESMTFSQWGLTGYEVQYWNGSTWATVTGGSVTGNNNVWRKFTFAAVTTSKIRVLTNFSPSNWSELTEVEAWSPTSPSPANVALTSNGATATASSAFTPGNWGAGTTNNGDRKGDSTNGSWNDAAPANTFPDWLQIDFNGSKTIDEIDVFTVQDNWQNPSEPTESMTFNSYGLTAFDVQYWNGSSWMTVPGGSVSGNNKVWRKFTFSPITTSKIRVVGNAAPDGYSRLTELEAWTAASGGGSSANVKWLVTDQLSTPRMVFDQTGSLANVSRHDYLPFGEELFGGPPSQPGVGGRTTGQGYSSSDNVRQKFTGYERDVESGLDYAQVRYYTSTQGRFASADNFLNDTSVVDPASWNLYAHARNNPLRYIDPTGEKIYVGNVTGDDRDELLRRVNFTYGCESCVSVDADGYLAIDTSGLSEEVMEATQFLTDAINSTDLGKLFNVEVTNNNPDVGFGDSGTRAGVNVTRPDGRVVRVSAVNIRLDFGDDRHVLGDENLKASFLNLVFAHEVRHFYPDFQQDPKPFGIRGLVDNPINEIRFARGIPLRYEYQAHPVGGVAFLKFGTAETDKAGIPLRGSDGIRVYGETGRIIWWVRRNVKGR